MAYQDALKHYILILVGKPLDPSNYFTSGLDPITPPAYVRVATYDSTITPRQFIADSVAEIVYYWFTAFAE